ncbi:MAG: hypothetical protein E2O68_02790 [Deltaproteobacteria bacterium]|nr:MAG: hypothetical protein E2O68_02790 [Deltaproteobacteria bacterium]
MQKLLTFLFLITLVSCGGADKGIDQRVGVPGINLGNSAQEQKALQFIKEFNDTNSTTVNGERPAYSEVVKAFTNEGGEWIVVKHLHRYQGETRAYYYSYNLAAYTPGNLEDIFMSIRFEGFDDYILVDHIGNNMFDSGPMAYWSETEGNWIEKRWIFENDETSGKDLEKLGSKVQDIKTQELKDSLIAYGMSEDKVAKIAKLSTAYKSIKNKRALTAKEKDVFTKELTGLSFDKASSVLVDEGYEALVEKASEVNSMDPEAIKELLNNLM